MATLAFTTFSISSQDFLRIPLADIPYTPRKLRRIVRRDWPIDLANHPEYRTLARGKGSRRRARRDR